MYYSPPDYGSDIALMNYEILERMGSEEPKPKILSQGVDVSFKVADGSQRDCQGSVVEVVMSVDCEDGNSVSLPMTVIVVPRREAEIEGILLGRNNLLHHGFTIESVPNLSTTGPRFLPRVRLPGVQSPIPFLSQDEVETMNSMGVL